MRRSRSLVGLRRPGRELDVGHRFGPTPPIDVTTVEYWDAAVQSSVIQVGGLFVDQWIGQLQGWAVLAPAAGQRPDYVLSDPAWNGTPIIQCSQTGAKGLRNPTVGATVAGSASRPYMLSAIQIHTLPAASQLWSVFGIGVNATSDPQYDAFQTFGGSQWRPTVCTGNVQATAVADTNKHILECWADGVNGNARDNGVLYQAANVSALGTNCTAIGLGLAASTNTHGGNIKRAFHMLCSSKPSEAYIAGLKAWLAYWKGTPP